ncbi:flavo protein oxygenase [Laetiporus sulphureus 93-53]|uniref:Flavo protein oxygenase n=1 Tax=Laetiporus sulphureus 93-53 TaxID=1314785 RepID=A0A165DCU3_9APHY|nr:flavo protein oxygenase [Laetiporus sulphureus 93-53]KZT04584.1 flavo protein oxygenase [Laetiporus sulphureus 93-53]
MFQRLLSASSRFIRSFGTSSARGSESGLPKFNSAPSFKLTQSPNPGWKWGEGLSPESSEMAKQWKEDEKLGWKSYTLKETHGKDVYFLLTSSIIPRPIAFISSLSADGVPNLAPMSYFSLLAHDPPMVGVSFAIFQGIGKNTRDNILATKTFTVNIISEPFLDAANACSIDAPPEVDEWLVSGLTPVPSTLIKPARVKESAISFECELFHSHDLYSNYGPEMTNTFIMGSIKLMHVRNAVLSSDGVNVDPAKLRPMSRLGMFTYARLGDGIDIPIPMWAQKKEEVTEVLQAKSKL